MTTVVFADIVGSTGIFEKLGDETASKFVTQLSASLSRTFEDHRGRVVKLLGDGIFVTFQQESDALQACAAIQSQLSSHPVLPPGHDVPVQMQMGVESGEVVEIDGDCFGDAVNCASRLADLAGAAQILTTQRVHDALPPSERAALRSLGPMYLRGKSEATVVYRHEWQVDRDNDATVMGISMFKTAPDAVLEISAGGRCLQLPARGDRLTLGRATTSSLAINDARVSRLHAVVEWRGGQFVLSDVSSFGTWVYVGGQAEPLILRRTECFLIGQGEIALGCARDVAGAPVASYAVKS